MRLDLIPERDRFIPGWHSRPDVQRAEFAGPDWRWPSRLGRAIWPLLSSLRQACRGRYRIAIHLAKDHYPKADSAHMETYPAWAK
jgi:hypothetical protein